MSDSSPRAPRRPVRGAGRGRRLRRFWLGAGLVAVAALGAGPEAASGEAARPAVHDEYAVKAAIMYNIVKFTRWPEAAYPGPSAPLRLCVFGGDPFGRTLDKLAGRRAAGRPIVVDRPGGVEQAGRCHVLFIAGIEPDAMGRLLNHLSERPVLTIADLPGFDQASGIISLRTVSDRVRFRINLGAADKAGLTFSSKLLALADALYGRDVQPPQRSGDGQI